MRFILLVRKRVSNFLLEQKGKLLFVLNGDRVCAGYLPERPRSRSIGFLRQDTWKGDIHGDLRILTKVGVYFHLCENAWKQERGGISIPSLETFEVKNESADCIELKSPHGVRLVIMTKEGASRRLAQKQKGPSP